MSDLGHELPDGTRDSVIFRHVMRAVDAGDMTREGYADEVRRLYWQMVPPKQRVVRFTDPETHPKPSTALDSNAKTVFRFWDSSRERQPAAIEEACAYALPEPYSRQCRQELSRRLGCRGALQWPEDQSGLTASQGDVNGALGELMMILSRMQENDGCIDPRDKPFLADFVAAGQRLEGNVHALVMHIVDAVNGKTEEPPGQRPLEVVR